MSVSLIRSGAARSPIVVRTTSTSATPVPLERERKRLAPRTGIAFELRRGQQLTVIDPEGEQVAGLLAFNAHDKGEAISSGRTLEYVRRLALTTGDRLWSNRSNAMLDIVEDTVGRHDFLLAPCSKESFRILHDEADPHHGCFGNFVRALSAHWIKPDAIPIAFHCFMNAPVDPETGALQVLPPLSRDGDRIAFRARMDLIVALTACAAPHANNGRCKPIDYLIE